MKKESLLCCAAAVMLIFGAGNANAQLLNAGDNVPAGAVIYSLPQTSIVLKVDVAVKTFTAGPYAKYAQKYLGVSPKSVNSQDCEILKIEMLPCVEADLNSRVAVNLNSLKGASANFLELCSQGLVVTSDSYTNAPNKFRFNVAANPFANGEPVSTLDNVTTTIYKSVKNDAGELEQIPIQQTQIVEKNIDKRAEETASLIFKLRQKRIDIITGETDATYSGEAMGAALAEIARLEEEYLSMFLGKTTVTNLTQTFDVVPEAGGNKLMYVAFRIADQGLVPANNVGGRPVVVELEPEKMSSLPSDNAAVSSKGKIYFRVPRTVNVKVKDGQKVLLQSRMPIYQLGQNSFIPVEALIK